MPALRQRSPVPHPVDFRIARGKADLAADRVVPGARRGVPIVHNSVLVDPSRVLAGLAAPTAAQEVPEALVGRVDLSRGLAAGVVLVLTAAARGGIPVAIVAGTGVRRRRIRPGEALTRADTTIRRSTTTTTG
ncbi:hypothetical protein BH09ACT8_BH09ACT8_01670 [soil metagenome]